MYFSSILSKTIKKGIFLHYDLIFQGLDIEDNLSPNSMRKNVDQLISRLASSPTQSPENIPENQGDIPKNPDNTSKNHQNIPQNHQEDGCNTSDEQDSMRKNVDQIISELATSSTESSKNIPKNQGDVAANQENIPKNLLI